MGRYPLKTLLSAREFREEAAKREAAKAVAAVEKAREQARLTREKLERHREWRPREEARLFEEIRGRDLPLAAVDRHRDDIRALREAEIAIEAECLEADNAVTVRLGELEEARRRQYEAIRSRKKIEEHRQRWQRAEDARREAVEEAELEDFSRRDDAIGEWEEEG